MLGDLVVSSGMQLLREQEALGLGEAAGGRPMRLGEVSKEVSWLEGVVRLPAEPKLCAVRHAAARSCGAIVALHIKPTRHACSPWHLSCLR